MLHLLQEALSDQLGLQLSLPGTQAVPAHISTSALIQLICNDLLPFLSPPLEQAFEDTDCVLFIFVFLGSTPVPGASLMANDIF
jgi:hypothetical protein